ncbi:hypothetical protein [Streptomyces angustmyceticus]|uniref:hypothetical protein n=1 Tax=Streptomyces angustmyceticus TaxID=285578 RepID=UPI00344FEA1B
MSAAVGRIEVHDYQAEVLHHRTNRPDDYHPAKAQEPRRVLTYRGSVLAGTRNGEGRNNWNSLGVVHIAVTGSGYVYGASVAACNGSVELGEESDLADLVPAAEAESSGRCQRPACRKLWAEGIQ